MTTFTLEDQPRLDDGTFTNKLQSSPEIALATSTETADADTARKSEKREAARDYAAQVRHSDPRIVREGAAALLAEVERTVDRQRYRMGLSAADAADAVGDTVWDLTKKISTGKPLTGGLVQTAAWAVCSRYVNGPQLRHETTRAITMLKDQISAREDESGRHMTSAEIAQLASEIREGDKFDERHRPLVDFHLVQDFIRPTSFSQFPDSYIDEKMIEFGYGADAVYEGAGSASDALADQLASKEIKKADALRRLWDTIAEDTDVPKVVEDYIPKKDAANIAEYMGKREQSVLSACHDFQNGVENKGTFALFAPFGSLPESQKDEVAEMLTSRPAHAQNLWLAALKSATQTSSSRKPAAAAA